MVHLGVFAPIISSFHVIFFPAERKYFLLMILAFDLIDCIAADSDASTVNWP